MGLGKTLGARQAEALGRVSPEETLGLQRGAWAAGVQAQRRDWRQTTRTLPELIPERTAVGWEVPSLTRTSRLSAQAHSTFLFPVTETSLRVPLCDSEPGFLFGHLILGIMTAASKSQFSILLLVTLCLGL